MTQIFSPDFSIEINRQQIGYNDLVALGCESVDALRQTALKKSQFQENAALITTGAFFGTVALLTNVDMDTVQTALSACASAICGVAMACNIRSHRRHTKNAEELDQAVVVLTEDVTQAKCDNTHETLVQKGMLQKIWRRDGVEYAPILRYNI